MNIMNRIKENKKGILGGMLALTIAATGVYAYLTDIENETNTYTVNEGWVEVGTPVKDADREVVKHVYAYAKDNVMTAVVKGDSVTLFNSVKFINIIENYGLEKTTKEINVTAKAIQTSDINGGKTAPADVLEVINNQGPTNVANDF